MPQGDGMGPQSQSPKGGQGRGRCNRKGAIISPQEQGNEVVGQKKRRRQGAGQGAGNRQGRGRGAKGCIGTS
jgi:hypothetical protein